MNILHIVISRGWHAQTANTAVFLKYQYESKTHNLNLITLNNSGLCRYLAETGIDIPATLIKHHSSPGLTNRIVKTVKEKAIEAIHIHGNNCPFRIWLALKILNSSIPVFLSVRDDPEGNFFYRVLLRRVNKVIVPNNIVKSYLETTVSAELPVEIINPLVETDRFLPHEKSGSEILTIGMFARFHRIKGYPVFFKACRKILETPGLPKCRFVAAGSNLAKHSVTINNMIEEYGLKNSISILGKIKNIEKEITRIDIGVIASSGSEELSRIALEYMSCGVPVVATRVGGIPECVTENEGILVNPDSGDELYNALAVLIKDAELRKRLGRAGRDKMLRDYSPQVYCKKINNLYSDLHH